MNKIITRRIFQSNRQKAKYEVAAGYDLCD